MAKPICILCGNPTNGYFASADGLQGVCRECRGPVVPDNGYLRGELLPGDEDLLDDGKDLRSEIGFV